MNFARLQLLTDMMFLPDGSGAPRERHTSLDVRQLNPLVLAYVGDAYFHLFVRCRLLSYERSHVQALQEFSGQIVSAVWQARAYNEIEPLLSTEEKAVFRRGRNAKSHPPRHASIREYHISTGFEALLGTLFLAEQKERLQELCEASFQAIARHLMEERQEKKGERAT